MLNQYKYYGKYPCYWHLLSPFRKNKFMDKFLAKKSVNTLVFISSFTLIYLFLTSIRTSQRGTITSDWCRVCIWVLLSVLGNRSIIGLGSICHCFVYFLGSRLVSSLRLFYYSSVFLRLHIPDTKWVWLTFWVDSKCRVCIFALRPLKPNLFFAAKTDDTGVSETALQLKIPKMPDTQGISQSRPPAEPVAWGAPIRG